MAKPSSSCGPMMKSDADYQMESDHRTMSNAAEIMQDKDRMAGVKKQHKKVTKKHGFITMALNRTNTGLTGGRR